MLVLLLAGCEKKISLNLIENNPKLVVEATIENGQAPRVVLTHSVGYFSTISYQLFEGSFVHNASVYVSNGTLTHKLKEYTVPYAGAVNVYYYSTDSSDLSTAITGQTNHSYSLKIITGNDEYDATTTIPNFNKVIDSLWWEPVVNSKDPKRVNVLIQATDPPGYGDYIRYFTRRNSQPFLAPANSVFDDQFIDGTTYQLILTPGIDRNAPKNDSANYFYKGDTVTLKLSSIDRATYDFWRTMEYTYASIGNPFSTPVKVISNISNGALGYFGGYASQYKTIIIPH